MAPSEPLLQRLLPVRAPEVRASHRARSDFHADLPPDEAMLMDTVRLLRNASSDRSISVTERAMLQGARTMLANLVQICDSALRTADVTAARESSSGNVEAADAAISPVTERAASARAPSPRARDQKK